MKKLFFIGLLFIAIGSFAQYPIKQQLGSDSTLVESKGGFKGRVINKVYTDTIQANTERLKFYNGAQIATYSDSTRFWIRDSVGNKWVKIGPNAGGGSSSAADSANTVVVKNVSDLRANNYHSFISGRKSTNDRPHVQLAGYYLYNDGGGGQYYFDDTCTHADDGAFYIKPTSVSGAGRWRPIWVNGEYDLRRAGAKGDGSFNNRHIIQDFIDAIPGNTGGRKVKLPRSDVYGGTYFCDSTITIHTVEFEGESSTYGSSFLFPKSVIGVHLKNDAWGNVPIIRNLAWSATAKDSADGHIGFNKDSALSNDANDYFFHGLYIDCISIVENIDVQDFSGHGIRVYGSVGDIPATNASNFKLIYDRTARNGGCGLYISGPDANQGFIASLDFRDNGLCGIWDASFLGNQFFGCMGHNNGSGGRVGGHYRVTNLNARTNFYGCYGEGGSNPSYFKSPYVTFFAGTEESGFADSSVGTSLWNGKWNVVNIVKQGSSNEGTAFYFDRNLKKIYQSWIDSLGGNYSRMWSVSPLHLHWGQNFSNTGLGNYTWQWGGIGAWFQLATNGFPNNDHNRTLFFPSWHFVNPFIGTKNIQSVVDTTHDNLVYQGYEYSDVLQKDYAKQNEIWSWRNIQPGLSGNGAPTSYTEGRTATTDGSVFIKLSGSSSVLYPGVSIIVNGTLGTIVDTVNVAGDSYLQMDVAYATNGTPAAITYSTPKWQAYGYSTGIYSIKPTLDATDYGYRYYATDSTAWFTWNGSTWIKDVATSDLSNYELLANKSTNTSLGTSNILYPTQNAVKVYVDNAIAASDTANIQMVPSDGIATKDIWINTTDHRIHYKSNDGWIRFVAITDSADSYDADARAYITAEETAGTTFTVDQKNAINTFYLNLKGDGVYTKIKQMQLLFLGSFAKNKINMISPGTLDFSSTNGTITYNSTGTTGNGSTGFINTGFNPFSQYANSNIAVGIYSATNNSTVAFDVGSSETSSTSQALLGAFIASNTARTRIDNWSTDCNGTISTSVGFFIGSRTTSSRIDIYQDGTSIGNNTNAVANGLPNLVMYLCAINSDGSAILFSDRKLQFYFTSTSLSSTDVSNFNTRLATLRTAFGL